MHKNDIRCRHIMITDPNTSSNPREYVTLTINVAETSNQERSQTHFGDDNGKRKYWLDSLLLFSFTFKKHVMSIITVGLRV